jgi:hypothetical protein
MHVRIGVPPADQEVAVDLAFSDPEAPEYVVFLHAMISGYYVSQECPTP